MVEVGAGDDQLVPLSLYVAAFTRRPLSHLLSYHPQPKPFQTRVALEPDPHGLLEGDLGGRDEASLSRRVHTVGRPVVGDETAGIGGYLVESAPALNCGGWEKEEGVQEGGDDALLVDDAGGGGVSTAEAGDGTNGPFGRGRSPVPVGHEAHPTVEGRSQVTHLTHHRDGHSAYADAGGGQVRACGEGDGEKGGLGGVEAESEGGEEDADLLQVPLQHQPVLLRPRRPNTQHVVCVPQQPRAWAQWEVE